MHDPNPHFGEDRRNQTVSQDELVCKIVNALQGTHSLTDEETQWVRLAIQREAQSIKLRQAVIEKTLIALLWAGMIALGALLVDGLASHGIRWK